MDRLRRETRQQHQSIERTVPLLKDDLTRPAYCAYLGQLLGFHRPLEPLLHLYLGDLPAFDLPARCKRSLLEHDLAHLGQPPEAIAVLPSCTALPPLFDAAHALGCLYVLEGSTLGGQILSRKVATRLGLHPGTGASYLSAYGAGTGEMWRRFCAALIAHAGQHRGEDRIVQAAQDTFAALEAWLKVPAGRLQ